MIGVSEREAMAYLIEENRVLRALLVGRRLRLTDDRRQLVAGVLITSTRRDRRFGRRIGQDGSHRRLVNHPRIVHSGADHSQCHPSRAPRLLRDARTVPRQKVLEHETQPHVGRHLAVLRPFQDTAVL